MRRGELLAHVEPSAEAFALALTAAREALGEGASRIARRALSTAEDVSRKTGIDRTEFDALLAQL